MISTVGMVSARVETSAPWHRFTTRCISPPAAARSAVSVSGVNTIAAISTPDRAIGAPSRSSPSSSSPAMSWESSTIGSTVATSRSTRRPSSARWRESVAPMPGERSSVSEAPAASVGSWADSSAAGSSTSWNSTACAPVWRHRKTAYTATVIAAIATPWTGA